MIRTRAPAREVALAERSETGAASSGRNCPTSVATAAGLQTAGAASSAPFCKRVMTGRVEVSISFRVSSDAEDTVASEGIAGPVTVNSSMMSSLESYPP